MMNVMVWYFVTLTRLLQQPFLVCLFWSSGTDMALVLLPYVYDRVFSAII
jgi:hypothetical protein